MKSIIINKNRWIIKNNKRHCLYYSSFQESILHNKKYSYRFQGKSHNYYKKRYYSFYYHTKRYYRFYWFNDKDFYL
jgi:hypothetical protein